MASNGHARNTLSGGVEARILMEFHARSKINRQIVKSVNGR